MCERCCACENVSDNEWNLYFQLLNVMVYVICAYVLVGGWARLTTLWVVPHLSCRSRVRFWDVTKMVWQKPTSQPIPWTSRLISLWTTQPILNREQAVDQLQSNSRPLGLYPEMCLLWDILLFPHQIPYT